MTAPARRRRFARLPAVLAGMLAVLVAAGLLRGPGRGGSAVAQDALGSPGRDLAAARVCIGCHSPATGPPSSGRLLGRWLAPNITPDPVSGIGAWSRDDLLRYLRQGNAPGRGQAGGPMAPVVEALQDSPDAELNALIDWMARQPAHHDPADTVAASERGERLTVDPALLRGAASGNPSPEQRGAILYNAACASCHGADGAGSADGHFPSMFHNSTVGRRTPYNLVTVLLSGVERHLRSGVAFMQGFDGKRGMSGGLTDDELAALANFVLRQFGDPSAATIGKEDIERSRLEWWGPREPAAAARSQPITVGSRPGGPGTAMSTWPEAAATADSGAAVSPARGRLIAVGGGPGGAGTACFGCHGLQGQGDAAAGFPRLAGLDASYLAKQMEDYASGARPNETMGPIARQLDPADRHSVALYYAQLPAQAPPVSAAPADEPLARRGAALYAHGSAERGIQACADCHGPSGQGFNPVYPPLAQPASYVEAQLRLWREGTRRNDPHNLMGGAARQLTDEDIQAVAAYAAGLAP